MANTTDFRLSLGRYTASFWPCSVAQERSWALLRFKKDQGTLLLSGGEEQGHITKDSRQYCLILGNTSTTSLPVQVTLHMASLDNLCVCVGGGGGYVSISLRKSTLNIHWKGWCWSWSSNTLATWWEQSTHWKRPWCWERLRAKGEEGGRGWDG